MVEKDAPKIAGTLLAISVAIGMLAVVAIALSLIDPKGLLRGIAAVGAFRQRPDRRTDRQRPAAFVLDR